MNTDNTDKSKAWLQHLTLDRLLVAIVFIALFAMAVRYPADSDTWWHLRAGQTMLESRSLLTSDIFSHTKAGQPWINHGFLAQILWYGVLALGGWPGLSLMLAVIVTIAFWLVWKQSEGNLYVKAFGVILGAIASSLVWAARPQMISFLFTALAALLLHRFKRQGKALLPWFPLLVLVWVNSHGGFAIAFILLICYAVGEAFNVFTARPQSPPRGKKSPPPLREGRLGEGESPTPSPTPPLTGGGGLLSSAQWRQLLLTIVISLVVVVINPYTWRMWLYPFQTVGIGVLRDFIAEWQSPNFHLTIVQPFLVMLLILLTAFARSGQKVDWTDLALIGAWTTLSLFAVRNVAIFALVCTPILIRYTTLALEAQFGPLTIGRRRRLSRPFYLFNWILLALLLLGAGGQIIKTLSPAAIAREEAERYPAGAVAFIREAQPAGPMFNSYNIGGYLMYHLWPDYPVFVDGRTDLYDDEFLRTYLKTAHALPGWQETLNQYNIKLAVIEKSIPLAETLDNEPGWETVFEDGKTIVIIKKNKKTN